MKHICNKNELYVCFQLQTEQLCRMEKELGKLRREVRSGKPAEECPARDDEEEEVTFCVPLPCDTFADFEELDV